MVCQRHNWVVQGTDLDQTVWRCTRCHEVKWRMTKFTVFEEDEEGMGRKEEDGDGRED
ncbi:hypothetical protein KKF82_05315 [Patescibacteria group bacterium]|nr:hypothetical protein [Patescibacteria group bacterium]